MTFRFSSTVIHAIDIDNTNLFIEIKVFVIEKYGRRHNDKMITKTKIQKCHHDNPQASTYFRSIDSINSMSYIFRVLLFLSSSLFYDGK